MSGCRFSSRRGLLGAAGSALAASTLARRSAAQESGAPAGNPAASAVGGSSGADGRVPFHGRHQAGIDTPQQTHVVFASFDLVTTEASDVIKVLRDWTDAAVRMTAGDTAGALSGDPYMPPPDSGDALGLGPRRLTLTFGFGPGLFEKAGKDRYGLRAKRPAALVDLHASTAISSSPNTPAAISASRLVPMTARWPSMPSASSPASRPRTMRPMAMAASGPASRFPTTRIPAWPSCAGCRRASCRIARPARPHGTSWVSGTVPRIRAARIRPSARMAG
jgi:hypothetical protein